MRHFDFSPFYHDTTHFDKVGEVMNYVIGNREAEKGYPPYNIEKNEEDQYRISLAVAGFSSENLNVEINDRELIITGNKNKDNSSKQFLHQGIAIRTFSRRFNLSEYVQVTEATHLDGMLHIDLRRKIPAKFKPRRLKIKSLVTNLTN